MNASRLLLILFLCFVCMNQRKLGNKGVFRIYRFEERCDGVDHNSTVIRYLENKLVLVNNSYQIYFVVQILEDIDSDLKFQVDTYRCQGKDGQCQPYQVLKLQNACRLLNIGTQPWSPLFNALEPPLPCPLKQGIYKMKKAETCDVSKLASLPFMGNYLWRCKIRVLRQDNNKVLQCLQTDAQILHI